MATTDDKHQLSEKTDMVAPELSKVGVGTDIEDGESREVFRTGVEGVEFRTVTWQRAVILFCKINFAMSILATPEALGSLGAAGGAITFASFICLNICKSKEQLHL